MKKKIIALYDLLLYSIICCPMIVIAVVLLFTIVTKGTSAWIYENWYLVLAFAIMSMLPIGGAMLVRYCVINNDSIYFHYFPFTTNWEKAANNIDIRWNQDVFLSEVKDIEVVKLTKEEKEIKVFYKHWTNKYLKINLKNGNPKYVYIGNYSKFQIEKIVKALKITKV